MIQQTYDRISKMIPNENIFVITNKEYVEFRISNSGNSGRKYCGRTLMKNTAACNLYMANKIAEKNPDATMIVFLLII
jgi:mannose-1-phosphate guanylyltransferase